MVVRGAILGSLKQDLGLGSGSRSQENDIIRKVAGVVNTTESASARATPAPLSIILTFCESWPYYNYLTRKHRNKFYVWHKNYGVDFGRTAKHLQVMVARAYQSFKQKKEDRRKQDQVGIMQPS